MNSLWARITGQRALIEERHLLAEQMQTIVQRLDQIDCQLQAMRATISAETQDRLDSADRTTALRDALANVEKQIGRAGREQLKANALAEVQAEQLVATLEALRAAEAQREAGLAALREQSQAAQDSARLEVVRAVLPALDGLDEALRAGQQLLATAPAPLPTFFQRMIAADASARRAETSLREGMRAWLNGLTFVRQRLLDVLTAEGVTPIAAQGQHFDPHLHVALEVVPPTDDLPPGHVAAELRRGYMVGELVLRHAEVAVSGQTRET